MKTPTPGMQPLREALNTSNRTRGPDRSPSFHSPIFDFKLLCDGEFVRRIRVLATSSEAALLKVQEQLDDHETLFDSAPSGETPAYTLRKEERTS